MESHVSQQNIFGINLTEQGKYSSPPKLEADLTAQLVRSFFSSQHGTIHLVDATAGNGGNTLGFARQQFQVKAYEQDPVEAKVLMENLAQSQFEREVRVEVENWFHWMNSSEKTDAIFFDPPWGGPEYKKKRKLSLFLSDLNGEPQNMVEIIRKVWSRTRVVFLKTPFNFDYQPLRDLASELRVPIRFYKVFRWRKALRPSYYIYVLSKNPRGRREQNIEAFQD